MPISEPFLSDSLQQIYPSNLPVAASDLPGWLYLEQGEIHVFLTSREQDGYGRRYWIATLHPGDIFPACSFEPSTGASDCEYGYLLVPQTLSACRVFSGDAFAAYLRENPEEGRALLSHLLTSLEAGHGNHDGEELPLPDLLELPETMRRLLRRNVDSIIRQERIRAEESEAEQLRQNNRLKEQFLRLREIVHGKERRVSKNTDPLLAALRVIAEKNSLSILADPPDERSADPESRLIEFCLVNQWRTRRVQLEKGYSRLHHSALIGFCREGMRPCIIELNGSDSVWYFPGEEKRHPLGPAQEAELLDGAYCFYETFPLYPLNWHDLLRFVFRRSRKSFLCILAVGILVGLFGLVSPVATAYVTGKIIPTANTGELWQLLILLLALTTGTAILNIVPQLCLLLFGSSVLERLMAALFDRICRLPIHFFQKYSAGDLCMRLFSVVRLQEVAFQVISRQFIGSVFALCSILMLFYYSWQLTLVAVPLVLLYAGLLFFLFQKLQLPLRTAAEKSGWEAGFLKQAFDGIAKIRGAGAEVQIQNRFLDEFIQEKKACDRFFAGAGALEVIGIVIPALISLLFYYLIGKVWRGSLELSSFLAFLTAYGSFQVAVISIGEGVWELISRKPEAERLRVFLESEVEVPDGRPQAGKLDGSLEFSHVTFGYSPELPPVLRDVSFSVHPGEFVAIVGPSGAGKSSLIRLLLGFETPANGSILYSGQDLRELNVNSVRRQLGVILQNSRIMPGSILENITTGVRCSPEEVKNAIRMAALEKDLAAMPMGIHTNVREEVISGGQQQRILIARALIGRPAIVIMDESTSALDNETQETVRRNIEKLNVTRIVIAHRLSTIINADRIYVLDRGMIQESGTFEELMSHDGVFRKLARRQMLS